MIETKDEPEMGPQQLYERAQKAFTDHKSTQNQSTWQASYCTEKDITTQADEKIKNTKP